MSWWSGKTNPVDLSLLIYASPPQPTCVSSSGRDSTGSPAPKPQDRSFPLVIPEIDIWRAATLMLKRYGDKALEESSTRADQLEAAFAGHCGVPVRKGLVGATDSRDALSKQPGSTGPRQARRYVSRRYSSGMRRASCSFSE